jgi:N-methylhydantoinase A
MVRVAFDVGGTFTDLVLHDAVRGVTHALKVPTTARNPSEAVIAGLRQLLATAGVAGDAVEATLHATTVATNAVLERKGAATGLITTSGFRDVLIIGRQKRYETYDLHLDKPQPLVARRHIVEVVERVAADGSVVTPLDANSLDAAIDSLLASGREAVAVSLLHAYARPEHERRIAERMAERAPRLSVSLSSDIAPKLREYERTNTTVANAYVRPVVDRYLGHLQKALAELGVRREPLVMQSNGGLISPALARQFPVRIIESGPAAGVVMCAAIGRAEKLSRIITLDMGGTTAKVGAIDDGGIGVTPTFEIDLVRYRKGSGLPISVPAVEMVEIGAGGGSIARADRGLIAVGPESAGAEPGPICYGRGGSAPTLTDANLELGYISPEWFNGGSMQLDAEAARRGIAQDIARPLGISVRQAAWGIHLVATSSMESALRIVSLERGRDPRRYALMAFGGAGPLHAARLARALGIPSIIVPDGAGVGSAIGLLVAEPRIDVGITKLMRLDQNASGAAIAAVYAALEKKALADVERIAPGAAPRWSRSAAMRYAGQGFEIHVDLPPGAIDDAYAARAMAAFTAAYARKYSVVDSHATVEAVDWSLAATLPLPAAGALPALQTRSGGTPRVRQAFFPEAGGYVAARIADRRMLADGAITGPAIIEDPDSTTLVPPGDVARLSAQGHLIVDVRSTHTVTDPIAAGAVP